MDAKLYLSRPPNWIDWDNEEQVVCGDQNFHVYTNGIIASTQYHPARLEIVLSAVHKINARYKPIGPLDLTGPTH